MKLSKQNWENLLELFKAVSSTGFSDVIVRSNLIRQFNDSKNLLIEVSVPEIQEIEFGLVKNYIPVLKTFSPQEDDQETEINLSDSEITISDGESELKFNRPDIDLLACDYVSDQRFSKLGLDRATVLMTLELDERLIQKISTIQNVFSANTFSLETSNQKTSLKIESWSKTGRSTIKRADSQIQEKKLVGNIMLFLFPFDFSTNPVFEVITTESKRTLGRVTGTILNRNVSLFSILTKQ